MVTRPFVESNYTPQESAFIAVQRSIAEDDPEILVRFMREGAAEEARSMMRAAGLAASRSRTHDKENPA